VAAYAAHARTSVSRHHASTRARLASTEAMAITGTASRGPNVATSTGIIRIEAPKPTIPPSVPATRPTASTSA
jgi:hypothetical protein